MLFTMGLEDLTIKMKTGDNTYMHRDDFLQIASDTSISPEDKQRLYNGEYKSLYDFRNQRAQAQQNISNRKIRELAGAEPSKRSLTDSEIQGLNPVHIDPRIESLKHLHPHELINKIR